MNADMIKVRAEENALLIFNAELARTAYISGEELLYLEQWTNGENSGFSERLKKHKIIGDSVMTAVKEAILKSPDKKAPAFSFCAPESLHIELTSNCPLDCPQCYKDKTGTDISFEFLLDVIKQADEMGVFQIALGGGEPLVYARLISIISEISRRGMASSITTGGFGFTRELLSELKEAGLNHIQISLNGSCEEIHSHSRDGYKHAINALEILKDFDLSFGINWVARMDNIDDFPEFIEKAKKYNSGNINILRYKPSPKEDYNSVCLSAEKLIFLEDIIKNKKGINIKVDSAFSNLLCHINGRTGFFSGCGAGRRFLALDADGYYRPCSHINMKEKPDSLKDAWYNSENLAMFRSVGEKITEPCASCGYLNGCFGCRAVVSDCDDNFYSGDITCPFKK